MKVSVISGGPSSASSQQDTFGGWGRAAEGSQDGPTVKSEPENRCRGPLRAQAVARETSMSVHGVARRAGDWRGGGAARGAAGGTSCAGRGLAADWSAERRGAATRSIRCFV